MHMIQVLTTEEVMEVNPMEGRQHMIKVVREQAKNTGDTCVREYNWKRHDQDSKQTCDVCCRIYEYPQRNA